MLHSVLIACRHRAATVLPAKFTHSLCKFGTKQGLWDPLKIPDVCEETHLDPYEFIYARYEFDPSTQRTNAAMIQLYKKWPRLQVSICNVYAPWCLLFCLCDRIEEATGLWRICCVYAVCGPCSTVVLRVSLERRMFPRSATCSSYHMIRLRRPIDHCTNCNTHSLPVDTRAQLTPDEIRRLGSWGIEYLEGGITRPSSPDVDGGSGGLAVC
jgi:hypothetical protein